MPRTGLHSPATRQQVAVILGFTLAYVIGATILALVRGNSEFIFYIVVMAVLMFGLMAVHRRVGLSQSLVWCLSLWGLLHMAGGLMPIPARFHSDDVSGVLYNFWLIPDHLKYDQVVHVFGFGITTWLCWQALSARVLDEHGAPLRPTPGLMVLCAAAGIGFGALNEVIEFVATLTLPNTNVGGYDNTGWDLVANLVGSVAAVLIISFTQRSGPAESDDTSGKS